MKRPIKNTEANEQATDQVSEQVIELTPAQLSAQAAELERDALAEQMAKELSQDEKVDDAEDFDPTAAVDAMTPEQEAAAMQATKDLLESAEGAEFAATGAVDYYEELLQEHCHERFELSKKKKENGVKRLTPVVQKYAPQALSLLGNYKNEIMAALWVGSLAYGSVKQIKALKREDTKNNPPEEGAEAESQADSNVTQEAA
jgi:hypothetical protein